MLFMGLFMGARRIPGLLMLLVTSTLLTGVGAAGAAELDRSGHRRVGVASFYAKFFAGRKMADGTRMDPQGENAASRTLPLGTRALVTNLQTAQSALVTIRDRGPYVKGRIVDLSPATARLVGITPKEGLAKVAVTPIELPDSTVPKPVASVASRD
jgi:rare lipoprotein A